MYKINKKSLFRTFIFSRFNFLNLFRYFKEYLLFYKEVKKQNIDINFFPILNDYNPNHEIDYHYTYHPAWALKVLMSYKPTTHIDLASKLDFSLAVSSLIPVEYHDYRFVNIKFKNFKSFFTDICNLPFESDSISSISCMHVIEHIGLGRYGDPIKFDGDKLASSEIKRVLKKNGNFLFVTPVAEFFRLEFNAHRVYSYNSVLEMFEGLILVEFSMVSDDGTFIENASIEDLIGQRYACGCFHFSK